MFGMITSDKEAMQVSAAFRYLDIKRDRAFAELEKRRAETWKRFEKSHPMPVGKDARSVLDLKRWEEMRAQFAAKENDLKDELRAYFNKKEIELFRRAAGPYAKIVDRR